MLILTIFSCNTSTEVPKGSLTGTVSLEGQSDFSGITVAIYDLAELDPEIVGINSQYPNIGIKITQHTEFDHRLQSPIKSPETDIDGSFELTKIPTGKYNLVAMKSDFGFKYLYEIEIEEGDNELTPNSPPDPLSKLTPNPSLKKEGKPNNDGVILHAGAYPALAGEDWTSLARSSLKEGSQRSKSSHPFYLPDHRNLGEGGSSLSFSSRRIRQLSEKTDSLEGSRTSDIILFPETVISGNISNSITVLPDHHLIIDDDTVFVPNTSSLTIHPGAVIRINPGIDLTIHGTFTAQGEENNMFWITSNDGFDALTPPVILSGVEGSQHNSPVRRSFSVGGTPNTQNRDEVALYNSMELTEICNIENDLIMWGKFDYANTCLLNQVNNLHMQNGIFRDADTGIKVSDVAIIDIHNINGYNCSGQSGASIYTLLSNNGNVSENIITNNYCGIFIKNNSNKIINNNYILKNIYGVRLWQTDVIFEFNHSEKNEQDLDIAGLGSPDISKNNFLSNTGILFYCIMAYPYATPIINQNNFFNSDYFIYIQHHHEADSVNAEYNYFDGLDCEEEIELKIYDRFDYPESMQNEVGYINFENFTTNIFQDAGIR